jgi:protein TonB
VSILAHLLLLFIVLPRVREVWPAPGELALRLLPEPAQEQSKPLDFEFVDLAEEREEKPPEDRPVPLSDLDRRAHGGEGESAERPASRGNTPQLIQSREARPVDRPLPPIPEPRTPSQQQPTESQLQRPRGEGDGEEAEEEEPGQRLKLPATRQWMVAPEQSLLDENPDRGGGQVDTGGLSFDTRWYDWGPYARAMLAKIRRNWYERMPEIVRWGVQGVVKIRFYIERDGTVTGLQILSESGKPPLDFAARDAIAASSAFDPLPADLTGVTREGVTITFYYNLRPPRNTE